MFPAHRLFDLLILPHFKLLPIPERAPGVGWERRGWRQMQLHSHGGGGKPGAERKMKQSTARTYPRKTRLIFKSARMGV